MSTQIKAAVTAGPILWIKQPDYPQFRFEWHPEKKIVYLIEIGPGAIGQAIAVDVPNQGAAYNAVLIWLRGYRYGRIPIIKKDNLSHG